MCTLQFIYTVYLHRISTTQQRSFVRSFANTKIFSLTQWYAVWFLLVLHFRYFNCAIAPTLSYVING